jgi:hypothetical protein
VVGSLGVLVSAVLSAFLRDVVGDALKGLLRAKLSKSRCTFMVCISLCSLLFLGSAQAEKPNLIQAAVKPIGDVKKALFLGNSFSFYNNGVHNQLGSLVRASGDWQAGKNRLRLSTLSGGHIYEHLDDLDFLLEKPKGTWQAVVLQGHSNEPISEKKQARFKKSVEQAVKRIKAKKLQPILLMTWGYKGQSDMSIQLANAYTSLANELDILVVPVGVAFWVAEQKLPNIDLFVPDVLRAIKNQDGEASIRYKKDLKHPSDAGTYLMACVLYASFYQKSPEGNIFTSGLDPTVALQLQKLSWLVTQGFYKESKG